MTAARPATATPNRAQLTSAGFAVAVVDPAAVVALSDPGVELTAPADGRLRGDGVALVVTGAALSDRAGAAAQQISAGSGRHLIVFGLRQVPQPAGETGPPASLALVVAGQRRPVTLADLSGSTTGYFAASIPDATTDATLECRPRGSSRTLTYSP